MMNKITAALVVALVIGMLSQSALALRSPAPIAGKVSATNPDNLLVTITDQNTGETKSTYTQNGGEFIYDWANSALGYSYGDTFTISVNTGLAVSSFTAILRQGGLEFNGVIVPFVSLSVGASCPLSVCGSCPTCPSPSCPGCPAPTECPLPQECPEPTVCPVPVICPTCPEPVTCPNGDIDTLVLIILGLLGASFVAGGATGYKLTVSKASKGILNVQITQHKHYGIDGYHSINTVHKNLDIVHPKGCINPIYVNNKFDMCGDNK